MNKSKSENGNKNQTQPRLKLGKYTTDFLQDLAGEGRITAALLDGAIRGFVKNGAVENPNSEQQNSVFPEWLKTQLEAINTNIVTLRYMVLALAAETEGEIESSLERLNQRMNLQLIASAKEANLDHPALVRVTQMMEENWQQNQNRGVALEQSKDQGREM